MADTVAIGKNRTEKIPVSPADVNRIQLQSPVKFTGENGTYTITTKFLAMGGESLLYLAIREPDKLKLVAKIYDEFSNNPNNDADRTDIIAFVMKSHKEGKGHLMQLIDHDYVDIVALDNKIYKMPVDMLPYFENGSMRQADYTSLRKIVIPTIVKALYYMHSEKVLHRDLKPANIYKLSQDEICIGDFGTMTKIHTVESQRILISGTRLRRGTPGYTAPEIMSGYCLPASDYYSFGCTIASFYKGRHIYQDLIDEEQNYLVNFHMKEKGLPLHCPEGEQDLQLLVDALTIWEHGNRAGYNDVILWLEDPKAFAEKWELKLSKDDIAAGFKFSFEYQDYYNKYDLGQAMLQNWDKAKDYLYSGGPEGFGTSVIVRVFSTIDQTLSVNAQRIITDRETRLNFDLGLAKFLHFLNDSYCPIYWKGRTYQKLSELTDDKAREDLVEMLEFSFLSWKYENWKYENVFGNVDVATVVRSLKRVETLSQRDIGISVELFKLILSAEPDKVRQESDHFVDVMFSYPLKLLSESPVFDDYRLAQFVYLGFEKDVLQYKNNISDDFKKNNDLMYLLLESVIEDKTKIREHYLNYSFLSPYVWLKRNLNLYSANAPEVKDMFSRVEKISLSTDQTIPKLRSAIVDIKDQLSSFEELFQNNFYFATLGINLEKDVLGITATDLDAFFLGEFFGERVPLGFIRHINYHENLA